MTDTRWIVYVEDGEGGLDMYVCDEAPVAQYHELIGFVPRNGRDAGHVHLVPRSRLNRIVKKVR